MQDETGCSIGNLESNEILIILCFALWLDSKSLHFLDDKIQKSKSNDLTKQNKNLEFGNLLDIHIVS